MASCVLPRSTTKRKAEEEAPAGEASPMKRVDCSELEQGATAARCEEAPAKKMTRLPQEEIESILNEEMDDDALPPEYRALKRHSPDLIPWPEEETDEELVSFYEVVRMFYEIGEELVSFYEVVRMFYEIGEEFREFQAWVRTQYAKNGYVEVDDEFLADRARDKEAREEARKEALKAFDFSVYDL